MKKGFTLIELMVVVVIIGILAAIAIPNFIAMQERGRQASCKGNMHTTQLSLESFAVDFNGAYPQGIDNALPGGGFAYYFPGGDEDVQTKVGTYPKNPYSGQLMTVASFVVVVYGATGLNSDSKIGGANDWVAAAAGMVRYGQFPAPAPPLVAPTEYGVLGARKDLKSLRSSTILVFHN